MRDWEMVGEYKGLGMFSSQAVSDNEEMYYPILAAEVRKNLTGMKNGLAPGPDRISKQALLDWDPRCDN